MYFNYGAQFLLLFPAIAFVAGIVVLVLKVDGRIRWGSRVVLAVEVVLLASSFLALWLASRLLPPE